MANEDIKAGWKYTSSSKSAPAATDIETISWTASEYIDHNRGAGWYLLLFLSTGLLSAGIYLLTKDYFATTVIIIAGIVLLIFSRHKPQEITYELSSSGINAGGKLYSYGSFKSFSVVKDGALNSISFTPLKRFMPPFSAYYAPSDEEKIIQALSAYLPYEEKQLDGIDRLSRRLRI